jgi:hypothetical protein
MKKKSSLLHFLFFLLIAACPVFACPAVYAQDTTPAPAPAAQPKAKPHTAPAPATDAQKNVQAYIALLRSNVRQEKAELMGTMMQLSAEDAAKFWPIYSDYDSQLMKLNNLRVANLQDYAQNYSHMTDEKADQLIQTAFDYRKQRAELFVKTYGQMKQALGAVLAARFLQIEDQLLLIIDLQIDSSLPIVEEAQ